MPIFIFSFYFFVGFYGLFDTLAHFDYCYVTFFMGGVPVKHHSKSKVGRRRAHLALKPAKILVCLQCKGPVLPHKACIQCGVYTKPERTKHYKPEAMEKTDVGAAEAVQAPVVEEASGVSGESVDATKESVEAEMEMDSQNSDDEKKTEDMQTVEQENPETAKPEEDKTEQTS